MIAGAGTTESPEQTNPPGAPEGDGLSPPPRPLTPHVRRRAWSEPHVRSWWLLTAALLLIGAYVAGREWRVWSREVQLIRSGQVVDAEITSAAGLSSPWQQLPPDSLVTLRYDVDGKRYNQTGYLKGRTEYIRVRSRVPVRIDPSNPDQWTARNEPARLAQQLTGAAVVLPVFLVMGAVSGWQRARLLRLWRDGEAVSAIVVESRQTALAPRSRLLGCTPEHAGDNRVVQVYVPHGSPEAALAPGEALGLIFPPGGRGRPVAAAWFA